jgi:TPP-dependent pyruvate/acetoin dehydrogenase alpha subunit
MLEQRYRSLYLIRRVEEEISRNYPTDKIMSPVHLSIGQEAISVAVCENLKAEDTVFGTYRCHALYLAKGGSLKAMIAELYGKMSGCAKGKAGSMHLIDTSAGVMGASAIVSSTIPTAVGYAFAEKSRKKSTIVASFFGDGAIEEGVFHESLNFAALKKLPVLFICENNNYAIHSPETARRSGESITKFAECHGIVSMKIERMNTAEISKEISIAVDDIRAGKGPRFYELMCYRWKEHVGPNEDFKFGYRDRSEAEKWFENDQVKIVGQQLPDSVREKIVDEVEAEIAEAFAFAESAEFPPDSELMTDLFSSTTA